MQKRTLKLSFLLIIFFTISLSKIGPAGLTISILAVSYMLVLGASALEDKNNSDVMLVSLPIKKKTIVLSKYVSVYVFAAYAILVNYLINLIVNLFHLPIKVLPFTLDGIYGAFVAVTLFCSISFPLIFKLGYLRSKMTNFILFFIIVFGGTTLVDKIAQDDLMEFLSEISDIEMMTLIMIPLIILCILSYFLSLTFYRNREF